MHITDRFKDPEYGTGVGKFMSMSRQHVDDLNRVRCPCQKCRNRYYKPLNVVEDHLWLNGFSRDYTKWVFHGESDNLDTTVVQESSDDDVVSDYEGDEMEELLEDVYMGTFRHAGVEETSTPNGAAWGECDPKKVRKLWEDAQIPLYPSCETFSKLSFVVKLLHLKTINNWSSKSFDMLLLLLRDAFKSVGVRLPKTFYEAKQLRRGLGFSYVKVDACKNDCVLFWKEHASLHQCPVCGESRWSSNCRRRKKIPNKVLRYFPLKPRLQRLFMTKMTARDMRWHNEKRVDDESNLRHPADGQVWKEFDEQHAWFAKDVRNVRLGLASDGFNPFGTMSVSYSMWLVLLVPYNLPPWKCMKEPYTMMALLIPGPKAPGNNIDVYLRPLIDELKELWDSGVDTYDAHMSQIFRLHAALLWTINDFPAYGNLSGWSTKGKLACPVCNEETVSMRLKYGKKQCYMGHRRFLPMGHAWRRKRALFDGSVEHRLQPRELSGVDVMEQLQKLKTRPPGKSPLLKKIPRESYELNWTKYSIFFELPYWSTIRLRHNLDVMHIEKNICDNILGTLLNLEGKTKDTVKTRKDLEHLGLRPELHIQELSGRAQGLMPPACYTLSKVERQSFCQWVKAVKFTDGYASNIARCVNVAECKLSGMKSHDSHVFLHHLLPSGIRGYLRQDIRQALIELSSFFRDLCARTLGIDVLLRLQRDIAQILCKLEMILPPSFFDIMVHLAIHLPTEALLAGPVQYRWMYPIERSLGKLKRFVRNMACPEGSIAEAYVDNECLTFCSMYIRNMETKFDPNRDRNADRGQNNMDNQFSVFSPYVRPLGSSNTRLMDKCLFAKAQWYVLNNCTEIGPYLEEHYEIVRTKWPNDFAKKHEEEFPLWFKKQIKEKHARSEVCVPPALYALACGAEPRVGSFSGCIMNGMRFHTASMEQFRQTQNSGVVVDGWHDESRIDFYGVLVDILELRYLDGHKVYLFCCDWWDLSDKKRGIRVDEHFTSVNISRRWYQEDPFILASQARQVIYIEDTKLRGDWRIVLKIPPRNMYDAPRASVDEDENIEVAHDALQEEVATRFNCTVLMVDGLSGPLRRNDVDPETVEVPLPATIETINDEDDDIYGDYESDGCISNMVENGSNEEDFESNEDCDDSCQLIFYPHQLIFRNWVGADGDNVLGPGLKISFFLFAEYLLKM
ncbi:hypothetical protein CJ030_MR5G010171 [Morella rubra]|uniref:DUF4218 domain-containing protein n=1 Tax=Morella rubra TaxID=262757 RepID=A0A6A1VJ59_9ROSI|nr:hypothetical protein CJ030_MR5G010171 [Morella rubra]